MFHKLDVSLNCPLCFSLLLLCLQVMIVPLCGVSAVILYTSSVSSNGLRVSRIHDKSVPFADKCGSSNSDISVSGTKFGNGGSNTPIFMSIQQITRIKTVAVMIIY